MTSVRDRSRWLGALAGLVPAGAVATLFAVSGSAAEPGQVAASLLGVVGIAVVAGWISGPVATDEPRRLLKSSFAYAAAVIGALIVWSMAQAFADSITAHGFDPGSIVEAVVGRAAYGLVSAAYLVIPAIALGSVWSLVARGLTRVASSART